MPDEKRTEVTGEMVDEFAEMKQDRSPKERSD